MWSFSSQEQPRNVSVYLQVEFLNFSMAFRECWCQNWETLAASIKQTIFINRFSRVDWLHLWCLSAGIPFIPKLQVSTKPWLDVDIYLHTVNSAKSLKHKIKKTNSSIVSMLILAPPCSMFQAWSQLHSTSSVDTKLLHLTTFQHLLPHTAAKHWGEGAKVCWCMTCWIFLTLTCCSHCYTI